MGCDIHFRVEYLAPEETVVMNDGVLTVEPEDHMCWQPAERLTPNRYRQEWEKLLAMTPEERKAHYETRGGVAPTEENLMEWIQHEPELMLDYDDRFYTGRNYGLFWMLTGTRGQDDGGIPLPVQFGEATLQDIKDGWGWGRGLPEDVSEEIGEDLAEDGDLHTHSWYTLEELLLADWSGATYEYNGQPMPYHGSGFGDTLALMEVVALEKCGGDTSRVRAVWAYDN